MAGSLNKVLLIGRLGSDPEIKQMVNGKSVARLRDELKDLRREIQEIDE